MSVTGKGARWAGAIIFVGVASGCGPNGMSAFDLDIRNAAANALDTSAAVQGAAAGRPEPDASGLITYPNYQVAVARRGDTVADVAARIGFPPGELADFNGLAPDAALNQNAVLALPRRVAPGGGGADIASIAGAAIDRASGQGGPVPVAVQGGPEPVRHQVARGETAFSIARLYGVSPRSLADWNGLGADLGVREGQFLIIPLALDADGAPVLTDPGEGTPTPVPPSASSALPDPVEAEVLPESPNLDQFRTEASAVPPPPPPTDPEAAPGDLRPPVAGRIIREFSERNEGVDIAADEGTPVVAAAAGTVAAITRDTEQVPILVLRHTGGLLTVYANIKDIRVEKDDAVTAGQPIASVGGGDPSFLHFEVRRGFDAIDPAPLLR